jgi:hypothetical protein
MRRTAQLRLPHMPRRLSALVLALVWMAAPLLAVAHAVDSSHRYCATHGQLEEGEGLPESGSSQRPEADQSDRAFADERGGDGHDGCAFARACRFGSIVATVILGVLDGPTTPPPAPLESAIAAAPVELLAIAPKTSPPVRAL